MIHATPAPPPIAVKIIHSIPAPTPLVSECGFDEYGPCPTSVKGYDPLPATFTITRYLIVERNGKHFIRAVTDNGIKLLIPVEIQK
jgi:hypothetical protein